MGVQKMRRLVCGLLGTALLVGQATAAETCKTQADQEIFDLAALKSEAMVLATSCHMDGQYNAFVQRYKTVLLANEHAFDAYFKRVFGRSGQAEHDAYITSLANAQSDIGLQEGTDFCPHTAAIFDEVMAIPTAQDLTAYAAGKDLVPANLGACVEPQAVATRARATTTTRQAAKH
jgi:ribosomal protein L18